MASKSLSLIITILGIAVLLAFGAAGYWVMTKQVATPESFVTLPESFVTFLTPTFAERVSGDDQLTIQWRPISASVQEKFRGFELVLKLQLMDTRSGPKETGIEERLPLDANSTVWDIPSHLKSGLYAFGDEGYYRIQAILQPPDDLSQDCESSYAEHCESFHSEKMKELIEEAKSYVSDNGSFTIVSTETYYTVISGPSSIAGDVWPWFFDVPRVNPDDTEFKYVVDWGDGSNPEVQSSPIFYHSYVSSGKYQIFVAFGDDPGTPRFSRGVTVVSHEDANECDKEYRQAYENTIGKKCTPAWSSLLCNKIEKNGLPYSNLVPNFCMF